MNGAAFLLAVHKLFTLVIQQFALFAAFTYSHNELQINDIPKNAEK